jgi:hypothetical protein
MLTVQEETLTSTGLLEDSTSHMLLFNAQKVDHFTLKELSDLGLFLIL